MDASPIAVEVAQLLTANPDFYNLPRKFKISATGCPSWCTYPEINDIGLTAVQATTDESGLLAARGRRAVEGAASRACASMHSCCRIRPCAWCARVTEIFRDQQGLRESRDRARMKYLFMKEGWTAEQLPRRAAVAAGFHAAPGVPEIVPDDVFRDHAGIHAQRQAGLSYVGASVLRGRLTGEQLEAAAELAETLWQRVAARHRIAEPRSSSTYPTPRPANWRANWNRSDCTWKARHSGAARSPAPARSSASSRSPKPRALRAGSWMRWKSACRSLTSNCACT